MTCPDADLRRTHETHKTLFIRDRPQNLLFVFRLPVSDIFRAKLPPKLELPVSTKYNSHQQEYGFYFSWLFTLLFLYCLSNLYFSFLTGLMGLQRSLLLWFLLFFLVVIRKAQVSQLSFLWQIDFIPLYRHYYTFIWSLWDPQWTSLANFFVVFFTKSKVLKGTFLPWSLSKIFQRLLWFWTFNSLAITNSDHILLLSISAFVIAVSCKALADFVHQLAHHKRAAMLHKSETLSSHAPVAA